MTFEEWFRSEQHREKYPDYHPVYIEAQEAWKAAHEECAEICDSIHEKAKVIGKTDAYMGEYASEFDAGFGSASCECADSIRARGEE